MGDEFWGERIGEDRSSIAHWIGEFMFWRGECERSKADTSSCPTHSSRSRGDIWMRYGWQ